MRLSLAQKIRKGEDQYVLLSVVWRKIGKVGREDGKGRRKAEEAERGVRLTAASGCGPRMRNFIPILLTFHEVNFHANSSSIFRV